MEQDALFGEIAVKNGLITQKQHDKAWKTLRVLRKKFRGKRKKPRLVDVLVQQDFLTGREARSIENARVYREARMNDKLYGRIALKSKFVKPKQVEKGLRTQKKSYMEGDDLVRLPEFLLDKNWLTEEQDEAIKEAMDQLDVDKYLAGRKGKHQDESDEDEGSEEELEELGSDLEELDEDIEIDLDELEGVESIDDAEEIDAIDSRIEEALSGLDGIDLEDDLDDSDSRPSATPGELSDIEPPRGLSSDDLGDIEDDLDDSDLDDDDDEDLGSDIELESEEVASASGKKTARGPSISDDELDLDDLDDIDIDLDDSDL